MENTFCQKCCLPEVLPGSAPAHAALRELQVQLTLPGTLHCSWGALSPPPLAMFELCQGMDSNVN